MHHAMAMQVLEPYQQLVIGEENRREGREEKGKEVKIRREVKISKEENK